MLSSCLGELGIPLESLPGNQASSQVEVGNTVFLSSCHGDLGVPSELLQGNQALSRVEGELGVLLTCDGKHGVPLELRL